MSRYFGRKYKLTLTPPSGSAKVFEVHESTTPMDIKFDVTYARGQEAREGTISILGLSFETIQAFLSLAGQTRGKAMSEMARVRLEAGYISSAGMVEILDGFAWYASVTAPPNMWLNIKVSEYNPRGGTTIQPNIAGEQTIKVIAETLMAQFSESEGVEIRVEDHTQDKLLDKQDQEGIKVKLDFSGQGITLKEAVAQLNREASKDFYFILRKARADSCRILEAVDRDPQKAYNAEIKVDKDHGLLSVTGIDAVNGCITTFIDGGVDDHFSHLKLASRLNPQANGTYYIIKKQYIGHYQGQEWYSRYFCSAKKTN